MKNRIQTVHIEQENQNALKNIVKSGVRKNSSRPYVKAEITSSGSNVKHVTKSDIDSQNMNMELWDVFHSCFDTITKQMKILAGMPNIMINVTTTPKLKFNCTRKSFSKHREKL